MYSNIKKRDKGNRERAVLIGAIIFFFFIYSHFYLSAGMEVGPSSPKFNSPDETANYFFAKTYAKEGTLRIFEPLNFLAENRIQPRSTAVVNGYLVPGSFLGLILLYGLLAKIFGVKIILCLTPFFAGVAVFCFYRLVERIFDRRIALPSALLLLIHPAFWYYSARGLFPNVLFVSLLIIGFYFLLCRDALRPLKHKLDGPPYLGYNYILAGLFFGLAMAVRLSEIIWVGVVLLVLFLIYRKKIYWRQVVLFLIFAVLSFASVLSYNQAFYGSPLSTAYNLNGSSCVSGGELSGWLASLGRYILPFGFHPRNILQNFSTYFIGMFWWLSLPLYIGTLMFLKKIFDGKLDKRQEIYFWLSGGVALFLFIYYGSWNFYDNSAEVPSIGTSYVRYWLPIYILSVPSIIFTLEKLLQKIPAERRKIFVAALGTILLFSSLNLTFFDKSDGLAKVKSNVRNYVLFEKIINRMIPSEAVIIVDRADKIFFPEHRVMLPLRDEGTYRLIPTLANLVPLYYYGVTLPEKDISYLYKNKIDPGIVRIKKMGDFGVESLYKLELRN